MWLRASELPKFFPVFGETKWRQLIKSGELPSVKVGSARVVRTAHVEALLGGDGGPELDGPSPPSP